MVDEDAPGVDAFLSGLGVFAAFYGVYYGYYLFLALRFVGSLQRTPFPGNESTVKQLPMLEILVAVAVAALAFGTISWLSANHLELAVEAERGGPYAAGVAEAFPKDLLPLIFALPPVLLFLGGAKAAWQLDHSSVRAALETGLEMTMGYLFTGVIITALLVFGVNHLLGTLPLAGLSDPRVLVLNPLEGAAVGAGIPLVFGTAGAIAGTVFNEVVAGIRRAT